MKNDLKRYSFIKKIILFFLVFIFISTCTRFSVLGELFNTRLNLVLKSTYETNDPLTYNTIYLNDYLTSSPYNQSLSYDDIQIYFDLADIRFGAGTTLPSANDTSNYWSSILTERVVFCSDTIALFGESLETCKNNGGIDRLEQFLNDGVILPARDIAFGTYSHVAIYMRRFIMSPARYYNASDDFVANIQSDFDNSIITGEDLINSQILLYNPTDAANSIPDLFPLQRIDLDLEIPVPDNAEQIFFLEIRIFIKSILMLHLIEHENEFITNGKLATKSAFIAPSDWRYAHDYKNISSTNISGNQVNELLGRQLLISARIYSPDSVGTLIIQSDDNINLERNTYYVLVKAGSNWDPEYELPLIATNANLPSKLKNIPLNQKFDLYKTCDLFSKSRSSYNTSNENHDVLIKTTDGFPETSSLCQTNIEITENSREQVINLVAENGLGCPCQY